MKEQEQIKIDFFNQSERIKDAYNYLKNFYSANSCTNTSATIPSSTNASADEVDTSFEHAKRVAQIVCNLKMDEDAIIASLLHAINLKTLQNERANLLELFGQNVVHLIEESEKISSFTMKGKTNAQADSVRKMIFALIDDIRVIIIKLADKLDRMRNLKGLAKEKQRKTASEALFIWAPIANRLGMSSIKDELEDLSLKFSNPEVFAQIKQIVALKKNERAQYLDDALKAVENASKQNGIEVTVKGRAKHFYSIYQKMRKRNKSAEELYDLLAMRILCKTSVECYTLIGIVHSMWKPLDGRFKDYIAQPKSNGYQSLHTTVLCNDLPLEIQIRTYSMHEMAENGVASHWLYKKGTNKDSVSASNIELVNKLKELGKGATFATENCASAKENLEQKCANSSERQNDKNENARENDERNAFFDAIKKELLGKSVFVFTPQGDVIELPAGSCAIDFAYAIHSAIGEKIIGAKADGQIIPLASALEHTKTIEILTSPSAHPTINQLQQVKTPRARSRIRSWLYENDASFASLYAEQSKIELDAPLLDAHGQNHHNAKNLSTQNGTNANSSSAQNATLKDDAHGVQNGANVNNFAKQSPNARIRIGNTSNFLFAFAGCCTPSFGDDVIGYVSRGRGIIVHKVDCLNVWKIPNVEERLLEIEWDTRYEEKKRTKDKARTNKGSKGENL